MSEPRAAEIMVSTPMQEWSDEMVAHWSALADSITRAMQQKRKLENEKEHRELAAQEQELRRLRAALAGSEQRAAAAAQEAAERMDAMRRHYDSEIALLKGEPEGSKPSVTGSYAPLNPQPPRTVKSAKADQILDFARSEWERQESLSEGVTARFALHWARLRSGPLFLPVSGFLSGLLIMILVYPLLRHTPVRAANSNVNATGAANAGRSAGASRAVGSSQPALSPAPQIASKPGAAKAAGAESANGSPAPKVAPAPDGYAVLLAGGKTLEATRQGEPSAKYEAQLAMHAGYTRTAVYQKNGRYVAAVLFSSQEQARASLEAINSPYSGRWRQTSSIVAVERWCLGRKALDPVVINGADVAVWSCGKGPG